MKKIPKLMKKKENEHKLIDEDIDDDDNDNEEENENENKKGNYIFTKLLDNIKSKEDKLEKLDDKINYNK